MNVTELLASLFNAGAD